MIQSIDIRSDKSVSFSSNEASPQACNLKSEVEELLKSPEKIENFEEKIVGLFQNLCVENKQLKAVASEGKELEKKWQRDRAHMTEKIEEYKNIEQNYEEMLKNYNESTKKNENLELKNSQMSLKIRGMEIFIKQLNTDNKLLTTELEQERLRAKELEELERSRGFAKSPSKGQKWAEAETGSSRHNEAEVSLFEHEMLKQCIEKQRKEFSQREQELQAEIVKFPYKFFPLENVEKTSKTVKDGLRDSREEK